MGGMTGMFHQPTGALVSQMKLENLAVGNVFFTSRAKFDADVEIDTLILKNSYFSLQNFEASNMFKVNSNLKLQIEKCHLTR